MSRLTLMRRSRELYFQAYTQGPAISRCVLELSMGMWLSNVEVEDVLELEQASLPSRTPRTGLKV